MRILKRLDAYLLKAYLQLFAGTFFICLFIFLLQFAWRYVDDLVGKGLSYEVLLKFFWYVSLTLIPTSLPLAVLMAALVTFGNLGERLELLSMKAAGISLMRIFLPIFLLVLAISGASYWIQNKVVSNATMQMGSLLWSMRQKNPEMEIPEGTFYNQIPGYSIYVEHKDKQTGVLYGIMIYSNKDSYEDAQIVLADSGRLQNTEDLMHLQLTLYGGERFQNMQSQGENVVRASVPYMRESFNKEVDIISFDNNFTVTPASEFSWDARTKDIHAIERGIDSLGNRVDSVGRSTYEIEKAAVMARSLPAGCADSTKIVARVASEQPFDSIMAHLTGEQRKSAWAAAATKSSMLKSEYEFRQMITADNLENLRRHHLEWHKKFTLSVACMVFFFIGAPLGAIIRKGGLGLPVVISVLIFIFYYIVNVSGEKLARTGDWDAAFGAWMSSMVLAPIGAFLAYKANGDSAMFNVEGYTLPLKHAWKWTKDKIKGDKGVRGSKRS